MPITSLLQTYARRIRELRRANADVPETALAPAFQQLLEALFPVCTENSKPDVMMVKPAEDRV